MKKLLAALTMVLVICTCYAQSQIITTGNNVVDTSNPRAADIVIGSDAGTRHDGSIMWWSNASASRIVNDNDIFYLSVWNTNDANVALSAAVGGGSYFKGSVGVGTADTKGHAFAVNGSAIATSMTVKLSAAWPDYVFKPTYNLPSLLEIKSFIDKNQHLPEVPSGEDVVKNGINLGEMNKILVKKVEELTLYLIQQKEQSQAQQKQIDELRKQVAELVKKN